MTDVYQQMPAPAAAVDQQSQMAYEREGDS